MGGCDNKKSKETMPSVLLSENQMVELMTDVQIVENAINYKRGIGTKVTDLKTHAYDTVFSHYGITDSTFYENLDYYNKNPKIMKRVLDSVIQNFLRYQEDIKEEVNEKK